MWGAVWLCVMWGAVWCWSLYCVYVEVVCGADQCGMLYGVGCGVLFGVDRYVLLILWYMALCGGWCRALCGGWCGALCGGWCGALSLSLMSCTVWYSLCHVFTA